MNSTELSPEEIVALALNEHGYLFQHKVSQVLQTPSADGRFDHPWYVEAAEVPVSLPNGRETRIDLVLRRAPYKYGRWWVVLECKRSARDFKRWIFFGHTTQGRGPRSSYYYYERADLAGMRREGSDEEPPMNHLVDYKTAPSTCPVFDYGVEAKLERQDKGKAASSTNAIEDAFQQVTLGQVGLAIRLRRGHELQFRLIPVVVTTAELMSAEFDADKISKDRGMIEARDLTLTSRQWLAVNYRISDVACEFSGLTVSAPKDIAADLALRQVRTVFVVQAEHVQSFLCWLSNTLED